MGRLAQTPPEVLGAHLRGSCLHNSVFERIVAAVGAIVQRWHCRVPTDKASLLQIPGVGPNFANLLAFVFAPSHDPKAALQSQSKQALKPEASVATYGDPATMSGTERSLLLNTWWGCVQVDRGLELSHVQLLVVAIMCAKS